MRGINSVDIIKQDTVTLKNMVLVAENSWRVALGLFVGFAILALTVTAQAKDIPGATQTSYGVSASGAFNFQIPIVLPQGRNGVQPNLSLNFSSSGGNGPAGIGWGLSGLGAISRCARTLSTHGQRIGIQHDQSDRFCLNGQQLILVSGTYGTDGSEYRTEFDQFAKIMAYGNGSINVDGSRSPTRWKVWLKGGSIQDYGLDPTTQFKLPGTNSIHSWQLSRVNDRNGNYYKVQYRTQDGYPESIDYTYGAGLTARQKIIYHYEPRSDVRSRYVVGRKITMSDRLKGVEVKNNGVTLREYKLDYQPNAVLEPYNGTGVASQSRLTSVTECGMNNECMPPIEIKWQAQSAGFDNSTALGTVSRVTLTDYHTYTRQLGFGQTEPSSVKTINRGQWVDINGDGEVDQVIAYKPPTGAAVLTTFVRDGKDWYIDTRWKLPLPLRDYSDAITNGTTGRFRSDVINQGQFADVNGDGLVDVVYSYRLRTDNHQSGPITTVKRTFINTGSGWDESSTYAPKDILFDYVLNGSGGTVRGRLMDINGDGLTDWVSAYYNYISNSNGTEHKATWLNNGNGWTRNAAYDMPDVFTEYRNIYSLNHGQFVDVNGDGLPDWVQAYHAALESPTRQTWLNTGTGWIEAFPEYNLPDTIFSNLNGWNDAAPLTRGRFVDINGDGLADWVRSYETSGGQTSTQVRFNTGKGWSAPDTGYNPPFVYLNHRYSDFDRGWPLNIRGQHIDINRDGLVDYVESYKSSGTGFPVSKKAWLNTGTGWQLQAANSPYTPTELYFDYSGRENAKPSFGQWLDINRDGAVDWVRTRAGTKNSRLAKVGRVNQIDSITTTMGVEIDPNFLPLTANDSIYTQIPTDANGSDIAAQPKSLFITRPIYVTSNLSVPRPDGTGYNTTSYQYEGMEVNRLRGNMGFKSFASTSSLTGLTQYREFSHTYPYIGRTVKSATMQGSHALAMSSTVYAHEAEARLENTKTYFVYADKAGSEQSELLGNGGGVYRRTTVELKYDDYGNTTRSITRIDDGLLAKVTPGTDEFLHKTTVNNTYKAPDTNSWLIKLVDKTTQRNETNGKPAITNSSRYEYYSGAKGLLHKVFREPDSTDDKISLTTTYAYDSAGNVLTETEQTPSNLTARVNTIGYNAEKRLPKSLTNSLSQSASIIYHPQCDQPAKVTDANLLDTEYGYDNFCRQVSEKSPELLVSTLSYTAGTPACTECQTDAKFLVVVTTQGQPPVKQYSNAFNQPMLTTTLGMDGTVIKQETQYDEFGRVLESSQPYFDGGPKFSTYNAYDILGRTISTHLPYNGDDGNQAKMSYTYGVVDSYLQRSAQDVKGRTTTSRVNALGQVAQVIDAHSKAMSYAYDSQGNLSQTTDVAGNSIKLTYDLLGRRTGLDDPDLGYSSYTFDGFSDLTAQTDAKNQTILMQYDVLGRLVQRTVPGPENLSGGVSTWEYDDAPMGVNKVFKGAVSRVSGPNGYQQTFTYDKFGRPASDATVIKGVTLTQRYGYNNDGFLSERYYPSSGATVDDEFGVKYGYQNGYLSSILSVENSQGMCVEHWRADNYDALGRVDQETIGKLVQTTRAYKPGQNVLKSIYSVNLRANQQVVQNLDYVYDGMNNLTSRTDLHNGGTETFTYDNLDRLRFHNKGTTETEVRYDDIGNITYKSDVGSYVYPTSGSARPHALTMVTGSVAAGTDLTQFNVDWDFDGEKIVKALPSIHNQAFEYDQNGNVTKSGDREFGWTAFDKPERIMAKVDAEGMQTGSVMEYGPEQQRIFKQEATFDSLNAVTAYKDSTIYLGKYYERITKADGGITHRYTIQTGGASIQIERKDESARAQGEPVLEVPKYLLVDNLGSTQVILNGLGEVEQTLAFDPWGMRLNAGDNSRVNSVTNRGYTGHEMDDETGLINMNARIYDPYLGRFLSADPVLPDAGDMQAFNRYSYVINNPLKYTDPTGNSPDCVNIVASDECSGPPPPAPPGGSGGFTVCGGISAGPVTGSLCNGGGGGSVVPGGYLTPAEQFALALGAFFDGVSQAFENGSVQLALYNLENASDVEIDAIRTEAHRQVGLEYDGEGSAMAAVTDFGIGFGQGLLTLAANTPAETISASPTSGGRILIRGLENIGIQTTFTDEDIHGLPNSHHNEFGRDLSGGVALALSLRTGGSRVIKSIFERFGKATKGVVANGKRGRASEARVLDDLGLPKNNTKVSTSEGNAIPDALTSRKSIEIKDCIGVSCTKQIRIQTGAARASGRESVLVTGSNTRVSGPAERAFDRIIRRDDLGPKGK